MYLDRNQALEKAFKEEAAKLNGDLPTQTTPTPTPPQDLVVEAAKNLTEAVKEYQSGIKKGYGRKTKDNAFWKRIVGKTLNVKRLYPARWEEVCQRAIDLGLLEIVQLESGREYWNIPEKTTNPLEEFLGQPIEDEMEEESEEIDMSDDGVQIWDSIDKKFYPRSALKTVQRKRFKKLISTLKAKALEAGREDGLLEGTCPECGSRESELYKNSKGLYFCGGCNDLHYSESFSLWKNN